MSPMPAPDASPARPFVCVFVNKEGARGVSRLLTGTRGGGAAAATSSCRGNSCRCCRLLLPHTRVRPSVRPSPLFAANQRPPAGRGGARRAAHGGRFATAGGSGGCSGAASRAAAAAAAGPGRRGGCWGRRERRSGAGPALRRRRRRGGGPGWRAGRPWPLSRRGAGNGPPRGRPGGLRGRGGLGGCGKELPRRSFFFPRPGGARSGAGARFGGRGLRKGLGGGGGEAAGGGGPR